MQALVDRAAAAHGLTFGPDTATANRATIGGMVGNDSAGTRSLVYGRTSHRVRRLRVVLADGTDRWVGPGDPIDGPFRVARAIAEREREEIDRRVPKILRCVDGYPLRGLLDAEPHLARFLVGSEGTLAVVCEIEVELDPRPAAREWTLVRLPGLEATSEATLLALETGPCAVEFVDMSQLGGTRAARALGTEAGAVLMVEHQGSAAEVEHGRACLERLAAQFEVVRVDDPAAMVTFRRDMNGIVSRTRDGQRRPVTVVEDGAVPVERLSDFLLGLRRLVRDARSETVFYGHASVGCVHARPLLDLTDIGDVLRFRELAEGGADLIASLGGALSGEHGDGILRSELLPRVYGQRLVEAWREVKQAFDPDGILNPGRLIDAPPLDANLRAAGERAAAPLVRGASACIGIGQCVERQLATMCPPYRITRNEPESTRGRANLLREIATGRLSMDDPGATESLAHCVACKACSRECPAGVDMAWLKSLHLADRRVAGLESRTARLLARAPEHLARASSATWAVNAVARVTRPVAHRLLDTPRRP